MDKDEIKGKVKDIGGRIQRQAGEWTGDETSQAEGLGKQAEGKIQNTWGKVKDAAGKAADDARREFRRNEEREDVNRDRDIEERKKPA
jgi:uncharacterized protein YjbJ (UPF0337 family)